ncbi:MAG: hypothetical protein N4J56_002158 [Chroococcidiopsis sp. SAG 2025]|nr:hypothetical protein [Chroococcidiopsis sp. SAG 2025]
MLAGAAITPTDPIVASSIVTGVVAKENLPARLRHIILAESGWNDGLGYPFVLLAILMIQRPPTEAISHWFFHVLIVGSQCSNFIWRTFGLFGWSSFRVG